MQKDLMSYVKVYKNFVDREFCQEIIDQLKDVEFRQHQFYNVHTDSHTSYDKELSISNADIPARQALTAHVWKAYHRYTSELGFRWFGSWEGFSAPRFNRYDVNTQMAEHCDHIHSLFDGPNRGIPTMTALGCLNNDYEGGDLIMWQDTKIDLQAGDIMVFPSVFLYPHRIEEITSGVRYSYVAWAW